MRFRDQIAVISGASSGIGRCVARALAAEGAVVVGCGRDQARLAALAPEVELALTLDVTDTSSVQAASAAILDRFGRVDLLVNNAGIGSFTAWDQAPLEETRRVMEVNLYGAIRLTQAFVPAMLAAGRGRVVNVSSIAGRRGFEGHTAYCASKFALIGWSEALRQELAPTVQVQVVCPPAVDTPFFANASYPDFQEKHPHLRLMSAEQAAAGLLDAVASGRPRTVLGARAQALDLLWAVAPGISERARALMRAARRAR